jgi:hypothetical protein
MVESNISKESENLKKNIYKSKEGACEMIKKEKKRKKKNV